MLFCLVSFIFFCFNLYIVCNFTLVSWYLTLVRFYPEDTVNTIKKTALGEIKNLRELFKELGFGKTKTNEDVQGNNGGDGNNVGGGDVEIK